MTNLNGLIVHKLNHTISPHLGRGRYVKRGQLIHESVFAGINAKKLEPKARLYGSLEWGDADKFEERMLEKDMFMNASALMSKLKNANEASEEDSNALLALFTMLGKSRFFNHSSRYSLPSFDHPGDNKQAIAETDGAAAGLLRVLRRERSKVKRDESYRDLLLEALAACCSTDEDKKYL